MPKWTNVYVDGLNFYYGAIRGTRNKWLNLEKLFRMLRPDDDIQVIHYFTALIGGSHAHNQETYLKALATRPLINVILGKFKFKEVRFRVTACKYPGSRRFDTPEEKRTDVNIALQMADDVFHDRADRLVLVSGDSDLVPAVDLAKRIAPHKTVSAYVPSRNPTRGAAVELRTAADKHKTFPTALLRQCQFPTTVEDGRGGVIQKPSAW